MRAFTWSFYNSQIYGKEAEIRCVFTLYLKSCKVLNDVTSDGRLFHVFAAATGKAWSLIVRSLVGGRASRSNSRLYILIFNNFIFIHRACRNRAIVSCFY